MDRPTSSLKSYRVNLSHRTNAYATHQPVLIAVVKRLLHDRPVLELGCGSGSTPLLHELCCKTRSLVSVDNLQTWAEPFLESASPNHKFLTMGFDEILVADLGFTDWGLVFIDQGDWHSRGQCITHFKDSADFIVVHDSDPYQWAIPDFKNHQEFYINPTVAPDLPVYANGFAGPPTLVLSNRYPCDFVVDFLQDSI